MPPAKRRAAARDREAAKRARASTAAAAGTLAFVAPGPRNEAACSMVAPWPHPMRPERVSKRQIVAETDIPPFVCPFACPHMVNRAGARRGRSWRRRGARGARALCALAATSRRRRPHWDVTVRLCTVSRYARCMPGPRHAEAMWLASNRAAKRYAVESCLTGTYTMYKKHGADARGSL